MIENTVRELKVINPKNEKCPVCAAVNSIYRTDAFQKEIAIPEDFGKGYYRRIVLSPSREICISDMTFYERMMMAGGQDKPLYGLSFCLGDALQWRVEGNKKEFEIGCGESYIFNGNQGNSICSYHPGQRFLGLSILLDSEIIASLIQQMGKERSRTGLYYGSTDFYKTKFSPAVRLILNEMINCRYRDDVKRIYLEGKILELVAVYLDELISEKGAPYSSSRFSSCDMKAIHEAKRILDENIASPPTLARLARLVCLNEYKLKTGFKKVYGMPVHAYVIDKRLGDGPVLNGG